MPSSVHQPSRFTVTASTTAIERAAKAHAGCSARLVRKELIASAGDGGLDGEGGSEGGVAGGHGRDGGAGGGGDGGLILRAPLTWILDRPP